MKQILDQTLEDYERISNMKDLLLEVDKKPEIETQIIDSLEKIILDINDDYLVRQHAAIEIGNYEIQKVNERFYEIIKDETEDSNIRINLMDSIEKLDPKRIEEIIKNLSQNDELNDYI